MYNGTSFERNEMDVSLSSLSTSSSSLLPVQNEVSSYPFGLNELCYHLRLTNCDLSSSLKVVRSFSTPAIQHHQTHII